MVRVAVVRNMHEKYAEEEEEEEKMLIKFIAQGNNHNTYRRPGNRRIMKS